MIANTFNNYFSSIGEKVASSIAPTAVSPQAYMDPPQLSSLLLHPVTTDEIKKEISMLGPSKTTGPFSIPIKLLKIVQDYLCKPLQKLFNCSLTTGTVPDKFKLAHVIPVFKKGSQTCVSSYRPISLLSCFNRLLEKLMYKRLFNFLDNKKILFDNQFGFRTKHSTTQATLLIIDKIQRAIEERNYSCGIFLDLSKAFDSVDHSILLTKLEHYGIRGLTLDWFKSYLSNRSQIVCIGNIKSDEQIIRCGVPQGSFLGPILFLLYINDFKNSSDLFEFHLFADDSNLFFAHKSIIELEKLVNNQLSKIYTWLSCNKLSLNVDKTNFVVFSPPQKKLTYYLNLCINDIPIDCKNNVNYLGIKLDSHLTFKPHVHYITKKIKRSIGILSKLSHYVNSKILIQLYYSLIYPYLTYGISVWGNTYITTLKPLYMLQKRAVRIITFSAFDEHSSPLFKQLAILRLTDLVTLHF